MRGSGRSRQSREYLQPKREAEKESEGVRLTEYSRDVRLMKRRKSSPPDDTATEESTPHRVSMALVRFALRPWIVSPGLTTQRM